MICTQSTDDSSMDAELLAAWRSGDMRAARSLYRRHFDAICRFFRNKLSNLDDVADLVGDTFLELLKTRSRASWDDRQIESLRFYLLGIARNVLYRHFRRRAKRGHELPLSDRELELRSLDELAPRTMSSIVGGRHELDTLIKALRSLPLGDQILLEAKYFEYLSDAALADLLEIPASTLPGRLRSARSRLLVEVRRHRAEYPRDGDADPAMATDTWIAELRAVIIESNPRISDEAA